MNNKLISLSSHTLIINYEYEANELAVKEALRISRETIEALTNKHFVQGSPQDSPILYIRAHKSPFRFF